MTQKTVVIRKIKRPEGVFRWPAYVTGHDHHGLWLYSPQGTIFRGQVGATIGECEVGQGDREEGVPVMHLIPRAAWWIAAWHPEYVSVDICKPPTLTCDEWCYTDLEIDLLAFSDGRVEIEDEDEFAAACEAGQIPPDEEDSARAAARKVERCMRRRKEPFGRLGWEKLNEALSMQLPPLRTLQHLTAA